MRLPPGRFLATPWRDMLNGIFFVAPAVRRRRVRKLADLSFLRHRDSRHSWWASSGGMGYGNFLRGTMPQDWGAGVNFAARRLLRIAVAFYGLNISVQQIAAVGLPGLEVSIAVVVSTLAIGTVVGQRAAGAGSRYRHADIGGQRHLRRRRRAGPSNPRCAPAP